MHPFTLIFIVAVIGLVMFGLRKDKRDRRGIPPGLLRAAKGDKKLIGRLVERAKLRFPGKPDHWYYDKVLYDIERDGAGSSGPRGRHR